MGTVPIFAMKKNFWFNENSLFAVLLRSPWWVSVAVGAGVFALMRFFVPAPYAVAGGLPFWAIAAVVLWRWLRAPSAKKVAARVEAIRAMSQEELGAALEAAFRRDGYAVSRYRGAPADLELEKGGRKVLVAFRRWKAKRTGAEPLRELHEAEKKSDASQCIYVATGEVTEQARTFAREKNIRLMGEAELAQLLGAP